MPQTEDRARRAKLEQLAEPLTPATRRKVITLRIDQELLQTLRDLAAERGVKYQTLMHQLLAREVLREVGGAIDPGVARWVQRLKQSAKPRRARAGAAR